MVLDGNAILHRRLYLGEVVYGATNNARRGGKRIKVQGEHPVTIERPDLRIISDELWASAHRVMTKRRDTYIRSNDGQLRGKPETGGVSRYLLGGFVKCAVCGGVMTSVKKTGKRGRPVLWYSCRTRLQRGAAACGQDHGVRMVELHEAIIVGLETVLVPEKLDGVLHGLAREWSSQGNDRTTRRAGLEADLTVVESELKNLTAAVASGTSIAALVDGLREREGRKRELRARLDAGRRGQGGRASQRARVPGWAQDDLPGLEDAPEGERGGRSAVLRDLRIEKVVVRRDDQGRWWYRLEGDLSKLVGVDGRYYAVTDESFATWIDEPGEPEPAEFEPSEPVSPGLPVLVPPG